MSVLTNRERLHAAHAVPSAGSIDVESKLVELANEFPRKLIPGQLADVPRVAFQIRLILAAKGAHARNCDLGAGIGIFTVGCAALGMRSILVDDFRDGVNLDWGDAVLDLHRAHGVEVLARDIVVDELGLEPASLDSVTCFGTMEHLHRSPKRLFDSAMEALVPGGLFVLSAPNCVNLRKRMSTPLGRCKWSAMADWYDGDVFRGHVREPDVDDLRYIARDLGLEHATTLGRNWMGQVSSSRWIRLASRLIDLPLRLRPSLCSDIYLIGFKPAA